MTISGVRFGHVAIRVANVELVLNGTPRSSARAKYFMAKRGTDDRS